MSVVYGTQESTSDQIESATQIIKSNIYEPLASLMQSTPEIFGGWEELNSQKSLEASLVEETIQSEKSPFTPGNEGKTPIFEYFLVYHSGLVLPNVTDRKIKNCKKSQTTMWDSFFAFSRLR